MPSDQTSAPPARVTGGRFAPGHTGNPRGRPSGSRNGGGLTARLDRLVAVAAESIVAGLVERAKEGDAEAAAVVLARLWVAQPASSHVEVLAGASAPPKGVLSLPPRGHGGSSPVAPRAPTPETNPRNPGAAGAPPVSAP
jgi:hypothetical protein